jgi:hypothetical protein
MFTGEAMCLLLFFYNRRRILAGGKEKLLLNQPASDALLPGTVPESDEAKRVEQYRNLTPRSSLVCLLPAVCDLGGTTLSGIGLVFTKSSHSIS